MTPGTSTKNGNNISVCICTYKRPHSLARLLRKISDQDIGDLLRVSIVVVDNDRERSAESVVNDFQKCSHLPIEYFVQPQQSIPMTRNMAVKNAKGEYLAFIDDDEFPVKNWLQTLYNLCVERQVDGVLGPVLPHFDDAAPAWVRKGAFYDRPVMPTGLVVEWQKARSGNVLVRREVIDSEAIAFRPEFRSGEDQDFFRRMMGKGFRFVWSADAIAYEEVPPSRWKRSFLLRRALFRGTSTARHPNSRGFGLMKSVIAVPLYTIALPLALVLGQHRFMSLLVKLCDHLGKLLGVMGIELFHEQYVID